MNIWIKKYLKVLSRVYNNCANNIFIILEFIISNLEIDYVHKKNGNHYLANLTGLLWIYMYFNKANKFNKLKKIFFKEIKNQFFEDGSNYECSTTYHRLSSELVAYGVLSIRKMNPFEEIPLNIKIRIIGMKRLLINSTGLDGNLTQVGDNDSGRVLKLFPEYYQ